MTPARRWVHRWFGVIAVLMLTACATRQPPPDAPDTLYWSGRLALNIASLPPQSLTAGFELKSQSHSGELRLLSPLGSTLAKLQWTPGQASLEQGGQVWQETSLDALLIRLTGTALPMAALIDWLQARPTEVEGWRVDLSERDQGKLWIQSTPATTVSVQPQVTLRLMLEP